MFSKAFLIAKAWGIIAENLWKIYISIWCESIQWNGTVRRSQKLAIWLEIISFCCWISTMFLAFISKWERCPSLLDHADKVVSASLWAICNYPCSARLEQNCVSIYLMCDAKYVSLQYILRASFVCFDLMSSAPWNTSIFCSYIVSRVLIGCSCARTKMKTKTKTKDFVSSALVWNRPTHLTNEPIQCNSMGLVRSSHALSRTNDKFHPLFHFWICLGTWTVGLAKFFGVSTFKLHSWDWPKIRVYTKFRGLRLIFYHVARGSKTPTQGHFKR